MSKSIFICYCDYIVFGRYTCMMSFIIVYLCDQATVLLRESQLPGGLFAWEKILQIDIFDFKPQ